MTTVTAMAKTQKIFLLAGCLLLLAGVQLGALGAHALDEILTPAKRNSWELAVQYQLVHGVGLILISVLSTQLAKSALLTWSSSLMLAGIFLFSGSIYLSAIGVPGANMIAPFGGSAFMLAWLLLAIAVWRSEPAN